MQTRFHWPAEGLLRVPAAVYTDSSIYQREQDRIFHGRAWNYVGLASEVPKPGDFLKTYVGEVSVILTRDAKETLRVFVNRCPHRGAQLCHQDRGTVKVFTCPYHAWSFNLEGDLVGIPYRRGVKGQGGMSSCFDVSAHGLEQLEVTERNGVVFASFAKDMEPLEEYLGPSILAYFDRVCDGRPLRVIGKMRHRVHSNWKLQIENVKDPIHAGILHTFFSNFGIWRADQETKVRVDATGRSSALVSTASFKKAGADQVGGALEQQNAFGLEDGRLIANQREYEYGTGAVLTIWPNLIFLQQLNCLAMRHVRPDGPDACIKTWTFFGYESDTTELLQMRFMQANLLGPSGMVTVDDNEVLAMMQHAFSESSSAVAILEAGEGSGDADHMMTESAIRGFYKFYLATMDFESND